MGSMDVGIGRVGEYIDYIWGLTFLKHLLLPSSVIYAFNMLSI